MYRVALSYCGSVIVAFILGSILATQFVLDKLTDLGIGVLLVDRLKVTFKDILGLSGTYLPLIAIAWLSHLQQLII